MGKNKLIILICSILLVVLIAADLIVSQQTHQQSQIARTLKTLQQAAKIGEPQQTPAPSPTPFPFAGYPKSYKNIEIPLEIYKQAESRYRKEGKAQVKEYIINEMYKYYIYNDYLKEEGIAFTGQFPITFKNIEIDVPKMEQLIQENLVTYVDFAYIKARFKYAPEEERIQRIYGDLKVKAREILEKYKVQFSQENVNPAAIIDAANNDIDLMTLNNNEGNRIESHYTPEKELFFTDKKFNSFVFAQKKGIVSNIFTLHGTAGDEYAYVIVFPIVVQKKQFTSSEELINTNVKYFKYY